MEIKRDTYLQQLIERKDNGMIKETYPAQLGVVYRIIKTQ